MRISIKYKFLSVMLFIMISSLTIFFGFVFRTFSDDKKVFVMDLNINVLKATTHEIRQEINTRLEYVQTLLPRIYNLSQRGEKSFQGYGTTLPDEVLRFSFYRRTDSGRFVRFLKLENQPLWEKTGITQKTLDDVTNAYPLPLDRFFASGEMMLLNRSVQSVETGRPLPVMTVLILGASISENRRLVIAVDFLQEFIVRKLSEVDLSEVFLLSREGYLLSHVDAAQLVRFSRKPYDHPMVPVITKKGAVRESVELEVRGEPYLCNAGEAGFGNLFVVSQIRKSEAFMALRLLLVKTFFLAGLITFISIIGSILFARRLTRNIEKLGSAAQTIGDGNLDVKLDIRANDEVRDVSSTFQWMIGRIKELLVATENKVRMEEELKTAQLMQSTILMPPKIPKDYVEIASHYTPATECGGDIWDFSLWNNKITLFIGDATGHGAAAALVTALVKSCFKTIGNRQVGRYLPPETILDVLNTIVYDSCRGKLLMTMAIVQLDLVTGELMVANAGHECPMFVRAGGAESSKSPVGLLRARGERLGYQPQYRFQSNRYQMQLGDSLCLYTDGLTEAPNPSNREFGERSVIRVLEKMAGSPVQDVRIAIETKLNEHSSGTMPLDDVTFVLLRWKKALDPANSPPAQRPAA